MDPSEPVNQSEGLKARWSYCYCMQDQKRLMEGLAIKKTIKLNFIDKKRLNTSD